jgi:hypothetical protein
VGEVVVPPAPLPALPAAPLPALPAAPLPALPAAPLPAPPPVVEWIVPPDGVWPLLLVELQPTLTPAAHHRPKAAMIPNRSFAISIRPVCIAFILYAERWSRHYQRIEARSVSRPDPRLSPSHHPNIARSDLNGMRHGRENQGQRIRLLARPAVRPSEEGDLS